MRRKIEDIIASQKRISWSWEWLELARYDRTDGIIAEVKYQFWDQYQKELIKHAYENEYESLAAHPLWVAKMNARIFDARQTGGSNQLLPISQICALFLVPGSITLTKWIGIRHFLSNRKKMPGC